MNAPDFSPRRSDIVLGRGASMRPGHECPGFQDGLRSVNNPFHRFNEAGA